MGKHDYDYLISIPGVCAIASKSAYSQGRQSIRQDAEIANPKEKFFQVIKTLLESVFTDGIRSIPSFAVTDDGVMSGTFKEAQARGQLYKFVITKQGKVKYNETDIERRDSVSSFPYWTFRVDARSRPQCSKGKRCKGGCIEKGRVCEVPLPIQIRRELPQIQKAAIAGSSGNWKLAVGLLVGLWVARKVANVYKQGAEIVEAQKEREALEAETVTITPEKLNKQIESEEDAIRNEPIEHLKIINPRSGKVIAEQTGHQTGVDMTPRSMVLCKGAVMTHNHPHLEVEDPDNLGVSLSGPDVRAAMALQMAEVRAVSAGWRHSMKPPKGGWNEEFYYKKFEPVYNKQRQTQLLGLRAEVLQGKISPKHAEEEYDHRSMEAVAKELGLDYRREPIPGVTRASLAKSRQKP